MGRGKRDPVSKITGIKKAGDMAQVIENIF
jgi:hypothetical protein